MYKKYFVYLLPIIMVFSLMGCVKLENQQTIKVPRELGVGGYFAINHNGEKIAMSVGSQIRILDRKSQGVEASLDVIATASKMVFHPTRPILLIRISQSSIVLLWDYESDEILFESISEPQRTRDICFSGNGKFFMIAYDQDYEKAVDNIFLYDTDSLQVVSKFGQTESAGLSAASLNADGSYVVAAIGTQLIIWNVTKGTVTNKVNIKIMSYVAQFDPTTNLVVSGSYPQRDDKNITFWDTTTCERKKGFNIHSMDAVSLVFTKSGKAALSGGQDGWGRLWNTRTGHIIYSKWMGNDVHVGISSNGHVGLFDSDNTAFIFDIPQEYR